MARPALAVEVQHVARRNRLAGPGPRHARPPCAWVPAEQPIGERRARLVEGDAIQRGHAIEHADAAGIQVVAFEHLQPQADWVTRRHLGEKQPNKTFAALHHRAHGQSLQPIEIKPALGIAGGAVGPAAPGCGVGWIRPAGGDARADSIAGPEIDDAAGIRIIAHGVAGAACHGGSSPGYLGIGAAAGRCPGGGAQVRCCRVATQGLPS